MNSKNLNLALLFCIGFISCIIGYQSNAIAQDKYKFRLQLFRDESYCIDVANARIANGTPIQIAKCKQKGHRAQTWIQSTAFDVNCANAEGGCAYQYKLAANTRYCLDYKHSPNPPKKDGSTLLQLWQCQDARYGDAAYWGTVLTAQFQANVLFPRVPNHDVFGVHVAVPLDGIQEGTKLILTEDQNTWHSWVAEQLY